MESESHELSVDEIDQIQEWATLAGKWEIGGTLVAKGLKKRKLIQIENTSSHSGRIRHRAEDIGATEADGWRIQAFWHTHVYQSIEPSDADLVGCTRSGLPWVVVGVPNRRQRWIFPGIESTDLPLIGRKWCHGSVDCYGMVRSYYQQILNLDIPEFEREDDWWKTPGRNLYLDGFAAAGFADLGPYEAPRQHDVLVFKYNSKVPNHASIYLGAETMLHHVCGCLSTRTFFSQYWQRRLACVARHGSQIDGHHIER